MYKRCISIRSCSQTRPGIWSQTRPGISLCSLSGLSLQGRGQFLVLLNQSEQDQESLSALALDCLCQTGLTPWSVSLPFHRTILLFLLLCKILFPGLVGALPINSTFNHGLHEGPSYTVLTIIKELLRQFEFGRGLVPNCIINFMFGSLK